MSKKTHAILIEGGDADSRMGKALELLVDHFSDDPFAEGKLKAGIFEDLLILGKSINRDFNDPEEKNDLNRVIKGEMIEDVLIPFFKQKPFVSTGRACIIPNGESLNETARNKLLKTLEEPVAGYVIIILVENSETLPLTIRSRCMSIWLGYENQGSFELNEDIKAVAGILLFGKKTLAEANAVFSKYEGSGEESIGFLRSLQMFIRDLAVARFSPVLIKGPEEYSDRIRSAAAGPGGKHTDLTRKSILLIEKAIRDISHGYRIRYSLRAMALSVRRIAEAQSGGH